MTKREPRPRRNPQFRSDRAPTENDFSGVARFYQLDGFLELRIGKAVGWSPNACANEEINS
jgi:hypothetical protein